MPIEPIFEEQEPLRLTIDDYVAEQRRSIRRKSFWAVGIGGFVVAVHIAWLALFALAGVEPDFSILFRSLFFVLGLFFLFAGIYGLYYAKTLSAEDLIPSPEAIEFSRRAAGTRAVYSYIFVFTIAAVFLVQLSAGLEESVAAAGLVKPLVLRNGEYWRILTGATLHGGLLHIYFNTQALYGFGSLMEYLSNRAHLAVVFLISIVSGGIFSIIFLPEVTSVGASGGIMGLIGYLAVYGYRRRRQLPPDFLKTMLINIGFIAAFGLIAYSFVDNFAHLGGFVAGSVYGWLQIPRNPAADPRKAGKIAEIAGILAVAVILAEAVFAIFRILGKA